MKLLRWIAPLLFVLMGTSACSDHPGQLAAGNSRIRVHCTGFDLNSHLVYVTIAGTDTQVGGSRDLACIFSGNVYIDVSVPPTEYNVYIDNNLYQPVTFSNSGDEITVYFKSYLIVYTKGT